MRRWCEINGGGGPSFLLLFLLGGSGAIMA
ncbi:hypothetical protein ES332_D07G096600v1 [Gossypium tomentosum]|uniref:Uncharacterized protein n=1 Tax=Gossypium tomentosum TaxID=34277 RepID=A0A5D2K4N3_GOSTO|nr:hypothetical protein ES332_D07G096600v1 [Gossypium tomentosum]